MKELNVPVVVDGKEITQQETVYEISEINFLDMALSCKDSKKRSISYIEIPCAFDIETTNIFERDEDGKISDSFRPYSFMYHWQFCIGDKVIFGRRWEEFTLLLRTMSVQMNLSKKYRLVIWVHNLPFEFMHMHRFLNIVDGFYKEAYKPLRIVTDLGIEFRCSYALSNMTLSKFCQNSNGVTHYKLSGDDYDYLKRRTANTELSEYELGYCYNDVRGLCECIADRMRSDTLASMPMTSTGYVRRDCRAAMRKNKKNREHFLNSALDEHLYTLMRDAFRGGDTHANYLYANETIRGKIYSYDITSSYPASMMIDDYPISAFSKVSAEYFPELDRSKYCFVCRIRLVGNVRYIGKCGIPYIPVSKCKILSTDRVEDNGRVLTADFLEIAVTSIDYDIILSEYRYDEIYISDIWGARKGKLPKEFRDCLMEYYRAKTKLKDDPTAAYEYARAKERLNALYGMMVMRIDQDLVLFDGNEFSTEQKSTAEKLEKYYKSRNSFLSYQHGVFVTANSRKRLRDMLNVIGHDVIYCDTDSIKYLHDHKADFDRKNEELQKQAIAAGAYADNIKGERFYLGTWDCETPKNHEYTEFKTLGAKKYVFKKDGVYYSTIAGVSKKVGQKFFNEHGIEAFAIDTVIENSGHLVAYYNHDQIHQITVDGCTMTTASNVALVDDTYTIGVTDEYLDLLRNAIDKKANIIYT